MTYETLRYSVCFQEPAGNPEKSHVPLSFCLSTFQLACISAAPNGGISMKFDIGNFLKICRETENLLKCEQKHRALDMKTYEPFIVSGDRYSP